jgi:hypothetical protein
MAKKKVGGGTATEELPAEEKKPRTKQTKLADGEWEDPIPPPVQAAADAYVEALRAANTAKGEVNSRKQAAIEVMQEHGVKRLKIDEGGKVLTLNEKAVLKIQKPEKAEGQDED